MAEPTLLAVVLAEAVQPGRVPREKKATTKRSEREKSFRETFKTEFKELKRMERIRQLYPETLQQRRRRHARLASYLGDMGGQPHKVIPLLDALRGMKPDARTIILAHLDDATRDDIYKTIAKVLQSDRLPAKKRAMLRRKLETFKSEFRQLAGAKASPRRKKKTLTQVGGGPIGHVIKQAIPLLLNVFRK